MSTQLISESFRNNGFHIGRMISGSKSGYRERNPNNEVYFNANIFTLEEGKVWYGDLDLTKDLSILETIAKSTGKDLYILREMDGRFENENPSQAHIIKAAQRKIQCN